jgi:DNA-binding beta-propeller fold protein YncE
MMKTKAATTILRVVLALGLTGTAAMAQQSDQAPLALETIIPLGTIRGRIDHLAVDLGRQRLFVAELENNSLGIVDLRTAKLLHRITGLQEPQGVGYVPSTDTVFVASGGDGTVKLFRGEDFAATGEVALGKDADNVRIGAESKRVYVGYGAGALAVIDPVNRTKVEDIPLPAHPESFQISTSTPKVFVNLPSTNSIAVLSLGSGRPLQSWSTGSNRGNFAMALDDENQRIVVAFRGPTKLGVFDMHDGAPVAERDTCGDVDDVFIDAKRQRIYVTCGEGFIDVFNMQTDYSRKARISTRTGARTSLFVSALDRLAVAVRASQTEPAAIWVYRPLP